MISWSRLSPVVNRPGQSGAGNSLATLDSWRLSLHSQEPLIDTWSCESDLSLEFVLFQDKENRITAQNSGLLQFDEYSVQFPKTLISLVFWSFWILLIVPIRSKISKNHVHVPNLLKIVHLLTFHMFQSELSPRRSLVSKLTEILFY